MDRKRDLAKGAALAGSVALLLLGACGSDDEGTNVGMQSAELKCLGGNACKAMSECHGGPSMNMCQGMNECKGMGWAYVEDEQECTDLGGTVKQDG